MNGAYTNGHDDYSSARNGSVGYDSYDEHERDDSRSRDRRPGGYGGFEHTRQQDFRPPGRNAAWSTDLRGGGLQRRTGARNLNSSRSRSRHGEGRAAKQIEDVLWSVKQEWNFMTEDNCVPVQVALQLLDESSLGLARRYHEFQTTQEQLQNALRGIVNEHHQGFNSSIGTFHQIQASIQTSHDRVRALKSRLIDAKTNLTTTQSEFQTLVTSSRGYDGMLEILNTIEQIKQVPDQLEARISEKRFLSAVDCLQEGLRLARGPETESIGALSDVKVLLSNQEHSLTDILTEELHNHLYLKSPYCEERWTAYAKLHQKQGQTDALDTSSRPLYNFLEELDTSIPLVEDTSRNPEADSFHYIHTLVESLNKLGSLENAVDAVEQRLPVELFKVVERTNNEIQQRHPKATRNGPSPIKSSNDSHFGNDSQKGVLDDLLSTLYARFEAIAESHRAFHDVIAGISKREDGYAKPRLTRSFKELWKLYQSEIRSILHDYLSTDGSAALRSGHGSANDHNIFRQFRDRNKKCTFKMDYVDPNAPEIKQERDDVIALWQKFVPGLVSLPQASTTMSTVSANGQLDNSGTGHKILVEPSVFNIGSLLPPSVFFLKRLRELVPSGADIVLSTLTSFLNDFLINVFHPQLEETLTECCSRSYLDLDAFQEDSEWSHHAQKPIFRGSVTFFDTVAAFCTMLDELTHDQLFSQLVIKQMNNYYDRCYGWYRALVTRAQPKPDGQSLKAAASFAETGPVFNTTVKLWESDYDDNQALVEEEAKLLLEETDKRPMDMSDLISDRKTQAALCLLYTSTKWMAMKLASLRRISSRADESTEMNDSEDRPQLKRSLTNSLVPTQEAIADNVPYLPLSHGTASLFDGIVDGFRELAEAVLRTLRLELRCQTIQGLVSTTTGSLLYSDPADVPDESVLNLVTVFLNFNQEVSAHLQAPEYSFVTAGLSYMVDAVLLNTLTHSITALNAHGAAHLQLNTRVLAHNLLRVEPSSAELPRSSAFLRLFGHGPDAIVAAAVGGSAGVPPGMLGAQELRAALRLRYSEAAAGEGQGAVESREGLKVKLGQLEDIVERGVTG